MLRNGRRITAALAEAAEYRLMVRFYFALPCFALFSFALSFYSKSPLLTFLFPSPPLPSPVELCPNGLASRRKSTQVFDLCSTCVSFVLPLAMICVDWSNSHSYASRHKFLHRLAIQRKSTQVANLRSLALTSIDLRMPGLYGCKIKLIGKMA